MNKSQTVKLAVLIDADNSSYKEIPLILQEIAKYGIASVKRVYGDWSSENLGAWRDVLLPHAITPIQQFAYTKGKDATDMMLIINAMDLLHQGNLDGFCLVSSDSDFTPLASRIRESGLMVYGFGKNKTPQAFINACDKFVYTENLLSNTMKESDNVKNSSEISNEQNLEVEKHVINLIYKGIKDTADDNGWANLADLGGYLVAVKPDFDSRTYGRAKLSGLLEQLNLFDIELRGSQKYVRKKPSFGGFIKIFQELIISQNNLDNWIDLNVLISELSIKYPNLDMQQYGCKNIKDAILKINSKNFEFNLDKTKIKMISPKENGE